MKYTIKVPKSLKAISAKDLIRFLELPEMDERQTAYHVLQIFCKTPPELTAKLTFAEVNSILVHMLGMVTSRPEHQKIITIEGVQYGFIPNMTKMSFGEFIDLANSAPEMGTELQNFSTAFDFLNVCYRPIIAESNGLYQIEKYAADESRIPLFEKHATAETYLGAVGFFLTLRAELIQTFISYLKSPKMRKKKSLQKDLRSMQNMDGSEASTDLQEIYSMLTELAKSPFTKSLPIYNFEKKIRIALRLRDSSERLIQPTHEL